MEIFLFVFVVGMVSWLVETAVDVMRNGRYRRERQIDRPISARRLREMNIVDEDFWTGAP